MVGGGGEGIGAVMGRIRISKQKRKKIHFQSEQADKQPKKKDFGLGGSDGRGEQKQNLAVGQMLPFSSPPPWGLENDLKISQHTSNIDIIGVKFD